MAQDLGVKSNTLHIMDKTMTITADTGTKCAGHESIAKQLNVDVYSAHPYHLWERGLNENANGLIR